MRNRLILGLCALALAFALPGRPVLAHGYEPRRVTINLRARIVYKESVGAVTEFGPPGIAPTVDWTAKGFGDTFLFKHKGFQGYFLQGDRRTYEVKEIRNQAEFKPGNGPVTKSYICRSLGHQGSEGVALLPLRDGKGPRLEFWPASKAIRVFVGSTRVDTPGEWSFVQKSPYQYEVRRKSWSAYYLEVDTDKHEVTGIKQVGEVKWRNPEPVGDVVVDSEPFPALKTIDLVPSQPFKLVVPANSSHVQISIGGRVIVHDADWQKIVMPAGNIHLRRPDWKGYFWSLDPKAKKLWTVTGAPFGKVGGSHKLVKATVATNPGTSITIDAQGGARMTLWGPGNSVRLLAKGLLLAPTNYFEIYKASPFEYNIRTKNWKFNKFHWAIDASLGKVWKVPSTGYGHFERGPRSVPGKEPLPFVAVGKEDPTKPPTPKGQGQSGF